MSQQMILTPDEKNTGWLRSTSQWKYFKRESVLLKKINFCGKQMVLGGNRIRVVLNSVVAQVGDCPCEDE